MQEEALPLPLSLAQSRGTIGSPEPLPVLRAFPAPREQRPKGATSRTSPKSVRVRGKTFLASLPVTDPSAPGIQQPEGGCRLRTVKTTPALGARSLGAYVPLRCFPSGSVSAGDIPLRRKHIIPGEHTSKAVISPGKTAPHPAGFPQCKESAKIIVL